MFPIYVYGFVYITTNLINKKRYLGMCSLSKKNHKNYLGSGKYLKLAIKKYGVHNFSREIIYFSTTKDDLANAEISLIETYNCVNDSNWYNIMPGGYSTKGFSGKQHTEETKALMRKNYSRPVYESTRKAFSENGKRSVKYAHIAHMKSLKENGHPSCQKTEFNGVVYNSKKEADKAKKEYKKINKIGSMQKRKVMIDDVIYHSITHASIITGISRDILKNQLSGKTPKTLNIKFYYT